MDWQRFQRDFLALPDLGFSIDTSRIAFPEGFLESKEAGMQAAFDAMEALEGGAIANPDEGRMVGHYWLRDPDLAPDGETARAIRETVDAVERFASDVHEGRTTGDGGLFEHLLVIGIGGSALGPQFVSRALGSTAGDRLRVHFFDNTDPDGMDEVLAGLEDSLDRTLCIVISKSGGTPETRNGMREAAEAYRRHNLEFSRHAAAVTGEGSKLDTIAREEGWLARFPMWDWVGGRTSELGPVGLLPAALQGIDIRGMLAGAAAMDRATRIRETRRNPAALLALTWLHCTGGRGAKDMVVLPYKDRLELFSRYLQQLVMESLGKEKDLEGRTVHQGISVYGNKGSTDQHAYVQQLRDGVPNFFAVFIQVLRNRTGDSIEVEPGVESGDFLHGFLLGTREALSANGRESVTVTIGDVSPSSVGLLIALFERAVGFYASLVGINAYHQPGVEAGKKAAAEVLGLQGRLMEFLAENGGTGHTVEAIAAATGATGREEWVFRLLEHLAVNRPDRVKRSQNGAPGIVTFRGPPY